ncbi:helix-turn-helix domain-containing protein [Marinobacter fonticola]|uniref:helix-turn-helix domain-containing protein n=1 Tax=Marinobacter fonticola TaxID=2603215 RepID=UPI001D0DAE94|nr:helix-turn-helix transcriptional regulator [Marinobacter fonticola]
MATDSERNKALALESLLMDTLHAIQSMQQAEALGVPPLTGTPGSDTPSKQKPKDNSEEDSLVDRLSDFTGSAFRFALRTTDASMKAGRALLKSQDQLRMMLAAGDSLKDIREVAGLTLSEMADALDLRDKNFLEAIENGTATLSFELILRLAALVARNDPIPFILRYTRNYNPEAWRVLNDWGVGRLPLQFERERQFINIFRGHDEARQLSDEGFEKVLAFTRQSFEMSLHFAAEQEAEVAKIRDAFAKPVEDGPGKSASTPKSAAVDSSGKAEKPKKASRKKG